MGAICKFMARMELHKYNSSPFHNENLFQEIKGYLDKIAANHFYKYFVKIVDNWNKFKIKFLGWIS